MFDPSSVWPYVNVTIFSLSSKKFNSKSLNERELVERISGSIRHGFRSSSTTYFLSNLIWTHESCLLALCLWDSLECDFVTVAFGPIFWNCSYIISLFYSRYHPYVQNPYQSPTERIYWYEWNRKRVHFSLL